MASNMKYICRQYGRYTVVIQGDNRKSFCFHEEDGGPRQGHDTKKEALFKAQTYRNTLIVKVLHKQIQDWENLQRILDEEHNKKGVEVGMSSS